MDSNTSPTPDRPLGFWLRAVDALLDRAIAEALADEQLSRRDWMLLNALDGRFASPWLQERLARKSGRIRRLADRGWATFDDGRWTLTDEGRTARERLSGIVEGVRERVAGAVSPQDFATTVASLESIARELGFDESMPIGRGYGRGRGRRGFGPGFGPGFRPGFGPAWRPGFPRGFGFEEHDDAHEHGHRGFGPHGHRGFGPHGRGFGPHERGHGHRCGDGDDTAFERGFTAGFEQGRVAASASPAA
ncbi:MarR family winged helix-turn-helix transcriptional regulator [Microbacterium sp. NPDC091313]